MLPYTHLPRYKRHTHLFRTKLNLYLVISALYHSPKSASVLWAARKSYFYQPESNIVNSKIEIVFIENKIEYFMYNIHVCSSTMHSCDMPKNWLYLTSILDNIKTQTSQQ